MSILDDMNEFLDVTNELRELMGKPPIKSIDERVSEVERPLDNGQVKSTVTGHVYEPYSRYPEASERNLGSNKSW